MYLRVEKLIMMSKVIPTFLCLVFLLSACSRQNVAPIPPAAPMPENVNLEGETQKHVHSSRHWQLVAEDMGNQLMQTIQDKKLSQRPVYIYAQTKPTTFTRAFNDFLITYLVNKGVKVSNIKQGSYIYNYKIQLVEYNSLRSTVISEKYKFTSLAAGFVVVRNIGDFLGVDAAALAAGASLDAVDFNIAPNLEIIMTSSILDKSIFISRSTDIYYANGLDKQLYQPVGQGKTNDVFNDSFYKLDR